MQLFIMPRRAMEWLGRAERTSEEPSLFGRVPSRSNSNDLERESIRLYFIICFGTHAQKIYVSFVTVIQLRKNLRDKM